MASGVKDLLGQTEVLTQLVAAARREHLHHCYIFEGPPQVGKHTAALRLAMAAACAWEGDEVPCGVCTSCRQIQRGVHPDVLLIEPDPERKSRTISVDQVREVIRVVRLHRFSARWRTVIFDPADGLMPQAANALLKTLEEPPPGTGFILVTSRVSALLPTVRSRSQRVRFRAVPEDTLTAWLVARGVEATSAARLARLSMGCPGKALALADGGLAELDKARDQLLNVLSEGPTELFDYAETLSQAKDARGALERTLDALEGLLRDAALVASSRGDRLLNADRPELVAAWATNLWPTGLDRLQREINHTRERQQVNVNNRLLVEALLARVATELGSARRAGRSG
jgi:DNA polymerase-3 subunit delta'